MIAVDTNVLVRLFTGDEPTQGAAARAVFESERIWIAKTVLLETAWVLKSVYKFDQLTIIGAFANLFGLDNVQIEDERSVAEALRLSGFGIELADGLHLSSRPQGVPFLSFDKALIEHAARAGVTDAFAPHGRGQSWP